MLVTMGRWSKVGSAIRVADPIRLFRKHVAFVSLLGSSIVALTPAPNMLQLVQERGAISIGR